MSPSPALRTILALETSCDETAAAVVRDGRVIVSNVVASQIDIHRRFGGVVPEVASRQHILALDAVVRAALAPLEAGWSAIDAVAATRGPGLAGALLTGLHAAKGLAWARGLPLIAVNHVEAHVYASWLDDGSGREPPRPPLVVLIVSGGHTLLAHLADAGALQVLGQTRDDAAGEAFDKVARLLGLGFPGGPAIERAARSAAGAAQLPRAWLRESDDFSFSGLKTAVLHQVRAAGPTLDDAQRAGLAAAFQESVVDVLVRKTCDAARRLAVGGIVLAGGVAANQRLRAALLAQAPVPVWIPPLALCTDNAAMIAAAAFWRQAPGLAHGLACDVAPALRLGQV